ncbi:hypothetical protein STAQ_34410 [Allostella sp. ATCC 35155]|nr:hypothetical protein STAQ_34410 [Stella sp. ATCC 35155]
MLRFRSLEVGVIAALAGIGGLVALGDRAEGAYVRWGLEGLVCLLAVLWLWRTRRGVWRPAGVVLLAAAAMLTLVLAAPGGHAPTVETFAAPLAGWLFLGTLAWLLLRAVAPRLTQQRQALPVLGLASAMSIGMLACSLGMWLQAVDIHALPGNPVVTTLAELDRQRERPWGERPNGIFAAGTVAGPAASFVAYYNRTRNAPTWLPSAYTLRLSDGGEVRSDGVSGVRRVAGWPDCGPHPWQRCLRAGDPVVIWADPGWLVSAGERSGALLATRLIAYGTLDAFRDGPLARIVATARPFGWLGLALALVSLLPAVFGLRAALRLRRTATAGG